METIKEHECKYCGAMTTQDDEQCYKNANNIKLTNMKTNKAEEILKTKPFQLIGIDKFYGWNTTIKAMEAYRQSEIDELKEENILLKNTNNELHDESITISKQITDLVVEKLELTKEVERLRNEREEKTNCDHKWINNSYDSYGFLMSKICDKCSKIEYV